MTSQTLIPYGMEPFEDEDLRFYFERDEPSDIVELARWSRIHRILRDDWSAWSDLHGALHSFYRVGFLPYAVKSPAVQYEHAKLYPLDPPPIGGAALVAWRDRQLERRTVRNWAAELYVREAAGTTTGADRLLLDEVVRESAAELEELVRRYVGRRDYLKRQDDKREREAKVQAEKKAPAASASPSRKHRRFGELPPEPEVVRRRPSR